MPALCDSGFKYYSASAPCVLKDELDKPNRENIGAIQSAADERKFCNNIMFL